MLRQRDAAELVLWLSAGTEPARASSAQSTQAALPAQPEPPPASAVQRVDASSRGESAYREAIMTKIVPAYTMLHDFIRDEYIPGS